MLPTSKTLPRKTLREEDPMLPDFMWTQHWKQKGLDVDPTCTAHHYVISGKREENPQLDHLSNVCRAPCFTETHEKSLAYGKCSVNEMCTKAEEEDIGGVEGWRLGCSPDG